VKLTNAQRAAVRRFAIDLDDRDHNRHTGVIDGVLFAYNGVSRATAAVLVRHGLATWTHQHVNTRVTQSGRVRAVADWGIELTPAGWELCRQLTGPERWAARFTAH
jgi:hypothetical protein